MSVTFSSQISIIGVNPYVRPPDDVLVVLFSQAGKETSPISVCGTINGVSFQQSLVRFAGDWRLYVNEVMARSAGLVFSKSVTEIVGQKVSFTLAYDSSPPEYAMDSLLQKAIGSDVIVSRNWEQLPSGRQKEILRYFLSLKSDSTRKRNLEKIVAVLKGEERRFMGRTWKDGK